MNGSLKKIFVTIAGAALLSVVAGPAGVTSAAYVSTPAAASLQEDSGVVWQMPRTQIEGVNIVDAAVDPRTKRTFALGAVPGESFASGDIHVIDRPGAVSAAVALPNLEDARILRLAFEATTNRLWLVFRLDGKLSLTNFDVALDGTLTYRSTGDLSATGACDDEIIAVDARNQMFAVAYGCPGGEARVYAYNHPTSIRTYARNLTFDSIHDVALAPGPKDVRVFVASKRFYTYWDDAPDGPLIVEMPEDTGGLGAAGRIVALDRDHALILGVDTSYHNITTVIRDARGDRVAGSTQVIGSPEIGNEAARALFAVDRNTGRYFWAPSSRSDIDLWEKSGGPKLATLQSTTDAQVLRGFESNNALVVLRRDGAIEWILT